MGKLGKRFSQESRHKAQLQEARRSTKRRIRAKQRTLGLQKQEGHVHANPFCVASALLSVVFYVLRSPPLSSFVFLLFSVLPIQRNWVSPDFSAALLLLLFPLRFFGLETVNHSSCQWLNRRQQTADIAQMQCNFVDWLRAVINKQAWINKKKRTIANKKRKKKDESSTNCNDVECSGGRDGPRNFPRQGLEEGMQLQWKIMR